MDDTDNHIAENVLAAAQAAATALRSPRSKHWIDQYRDGEIVLCSLAAYIAEVSDDTILKRYYASLKTPEPLGILIGHKLLLVDLGRLLDWIEKHKDLHARRVAESIAKKYFADLRSSPQNSIQFAGVAAAGPLPNPPKRVIS